MLTLLPDADKPIFPAASPNTMRTYHTQWRIFSEWALQKRSARLPASPETVAKYLTERSERGASASTIRASATAIGAFHRKNELESPTYSWLVRSTVRTLTHQHKEPTTSAKPLNDKALLSILSTALTRRIGRGGFREKRSTAKRRGKWDIAMVRLLSDAPLGRSEAAALVWGDVTQSSKGRGFIRVRSSYARSGERAERIPISRDTMRALRAIRMKTFTSDMPVLGLSESQIHRRIKAAASAAGLGDGYGGNSGRAAARRMRESRRSRDVITMQRRPWRSSNCRIGRPSRSPATVERRSLGVKPSFELGHRGTTPGSNVNDMLPEGHMPQRQEYPNASPEE